MNPARAAAMAAGETCFVSSTPCKRGHVGARYTSNGACTQCIRASARHSRRKGHSSSGDITVFGPLDRQRVFEMLATVLLGPHADEVATIINNYHKELFK